MNTGLYSFSNIPLFYAGTVLGEVQVATPSPIIFPNIDQSFNHLRLLVTARMNVSGPSYIGLQFNGDATQADYFQQYHYVYGTNHAIGSSAASACGWITGTGEAAGYYGQVIIDILNYSKSFFYKIATNQSFCINANGNHITNYGSMQWNSKSPITDIKIGAQAACNNFAVNSIAQLIAYNS